MGVDLSEFAAKGSPRKHCWWLSLTKEQQEKVLAAREAEYTEKTILSVISEWLGTPMPRTTVRNHFAEGHHCER